MFLDIYPGPPPVPTGERFCYWVESNTRPGVRYRVDLTANEGGGICQCRDHPTRRQVALDAGAEILTRATTCKHLDKAYAYFFRAVMRGLASQEDTQPNENHIA